MMKLLLMLLIGICTNSLAAEPELLGTAPFAFKEDQKVLINENQGSAELRADAYAKLTQENIRIEVNLSEQRARVYAGDEVAVDTPISTGRDGDRTPSGKFTIMERLKSHRSSLFGEFVNSNGSVVRSGVTPNSPLPNGATFRGVLMPYWKRLTAGGIGMHVGKLPGEPASHGCFRFPAEVMPFVYAKTFVGTRITIVPGKLAPH